MADDTLAANIPLITYRGDSKIWSFQIKKISDDAGLEITDFALKMSVDTLEEPLDTDYPSATLVFDVDCEVIDAIEGIFTVQPTSANTSVDPGEYFYDIHFTNVSNNETIVKSTFTVVQDIGK